MLSPGAGIDTPMMIGNRRLLNMITRTQSKCEMWRCQLLQIFSVFFFGSYSREATRRRAPELPATTRSRCDGPPDAEAISMRAVASGRLSLVMNAV
jgi:hypothetical protein